MSINLIERDNDKSPTNIEISTENATEEELVKVTTTWGNIFVRAELANDGDFSETERTRREELTEKHRIKRAVKHAATKETDKPKTRESDKEKANTYRRAIPRKTRQEVLSRDNHMCRTCGERKNLQLHHIKHRAAGGRDTADNLLTLCKGCHAEKHKGEPVYNLMR